MLNGLSQLTDNHHKRAYQDSYLTTLTRSTSIDGINRFNFTRTGQMAQKQSPNFEANPELALGFSSNRIRLYFRLWIT